MTAGVDGAGRAGLAAAAPARPLRHYPRCFGCGTANASGLRLEVSWTGAEASVTHVCPPDSEGGPGVVHGGYLAALVDEVTALVAAEHAGAPAMTKRLDVDYQAPVPVGRPVTLRARVAEEGRRLLVVRLEAHAEGGARPLFTARVVFVRVSRAVWLRAMQAGGRGPDRVDWAGGDPSTFLRWQLDGGLAQVLVPGRLDREVRVRLVVPDAGADGADGPADWLVTAGPAGLVAAPYPASGPAVDARVTAPFRHWQQLVRGTAGLADLTSAGSVELDGSAEAVVALVAALDFGRFG